MRGDRRPVSPTELAQLARCEQQVLYDRQFGARRSEHWQKRSAEGKRVHAELERKVAMPPPRRSRPLVMVLVAALVMALLALLLLARGDARPSQDLLPPELRGATLEMSEKPLVRKKPVHIRGRPDEVWIKDGRRYIIETKSRAGRVFEGDRMQLAAYAYMLRGVAGPPLASHGFIRFTGGGASPAQGPSFAKVALRDDQAVVDAHRHLAALMDKTVQPSFARQAAICQGCGHAPRCPGAKQARLS